MFLCICHAVTEGDVSESVRQGRDTPDAVAEHTGASTSCGSCRERLCGLVRATRATDAVHAMHAMDASVA
jgi:bacterioferritin-associated ferredoxin